MDYGTMQHRFRHYVVQQLQAAMVYRMQTGLVIRIWTALLTYVLLRFIEYLSKWEGSFARLFTTIRGVLWSRYDLFRILEFCGTASGRQRTCAQPDQLFIPGLERFLVGQQT